MEKYKVRILDKGEVIDALFNTKVVICVDIDNYESFDVSCLTIAEIRDDLKRNH